ncbi:phenylacetate-CoA oxygenase/reductase subunit PaaK [Pseudonocardiaceae bacterium YIM PH 21723]|nr:phenylacetate-CoA oxygenase/reductase subunit PaaK [Pseudonocardiaceae bacterium YIM PH 21723]
MITPIRRAVFHALTVSHVDRLCDDAVAITFAVPADLTADFAFRAGQYLTLRHGEERRSYSICAPEGAAPRIGVRRVDGGLFSSWLVDEVQPGDVLDVQPPQGTFTPEPGLPEYHAFIAAGSGITPVLSIVATVLAAHPDARATLIYGNRRTDTVMFADDLADLKDRYPDRFQLIHVLSREMRDVELFSGRLDADRLHRLLSSVVPSDAVHHWWLCGPFGLIQSTGEVLAARAVTSVHRELFYVDEPPPELRHEDEVLVDGASSEVTVVLDGRSTTMTLPRDAPVLDSAQRVRGDLPFACKGGVCGTCRALVCDGSTRMRRNYALESHEVEAGFVLTCQALPTSDKVTIDFDA